MNRDPTPIVIASQNEFSGGGPDYIRQALISGGIRYIEDKSVSILKNLIPKRPRGRVGPQIMNGRSSPSHEQVIVEIPTQKRLAPLPFRH